MQPRSPSAARRTPCSGRIYDALPPESRTARARLLVPKAGAGLASERACVLHLAGTGDFTHDRRLNLGAPLVAQARPPHTGRGEIAVVAQVSEGFWKGLGTSDVPGWGPLGM